MNKLELTSVIAYIIDQNRAYHEVHLVFDRVNCILSTGLES